MSDDNQDLRRFADLRFSKLLSDGFRLFAKNWFKLILPFALLLVISIVISNLLVINLNWQYYQMTPIVDAIYQKDPLSITDADLNILVEYLVLTYVINLISSISGAIFTTLAMSIVAVQLYNSYTNYVGNFKEGFKSIFNSKFLIILLIFGIFVPLGTLLIFIPSTILLGYYIFVFFTYRENQIDKPLSEARNLSRGNFWRIIGAFIITSIIISTINLVYQFIIGFFWNIDSATVVSWYNPNTRNYFLIIMDDIIYYQLIGLIFSPLFICILTPIYTSLKAKKEFGYMYQKGGYAMQQRYAQTTRISNEQIEDMSIEGSQESDQGFFCPFCGFHMKTKLKFCGNCGESLDFES